MLRTASMTLLLAFAALAFAPAQAQTGDVADIEAVAGEYALGFHLSEPERLLATVHRDLSKRGVNSVGEPRTEVLAWLEGDFLRYMGANYGRGGRFDETTQRIVTVFEVSGDVAVLELVAGDWYDGFIAIRTAQGWRLLDCVWGSLGEYEPPEQDAGEAAEVRRLFAAFARAAAVGDAVVLDRTMHAQAQMRMLESGVLHALTREQIYRGVQADATGEPEALVYNATRRTAIGRVQLATSTYWLQAVRLNGEWHVVNVHWRRG